jgi:phospholipid/cholesterol/gamma-HCH transport system substrate-binding protein
MITRAIRIQVLVFLMVSVLGVAFVGLRYVGLGDRLLHRTYLVTVDLAETGGIFPNAAVTYRGVPIGRVGAVHLQGDGVRVELWVEHGVAVPVDLTAVVAARSAVGEQYIDLRPNTDTGPYLKDGDTIPRARTATPLPVETLLEGLDSLVSSVGVENLAVVVDELGRAFEGNGTALARLLDANSALLDDAARHLPETLALIRDSRTVLATQAESGSDIRRWARSLSQLAATVRKADPDLRRLLAEGPPAAAQVMKLLRDLDPAIGTLLANLVTVNDIAARRLHGIEQILVVYPLTVGGGFTVAPGDGTAHLGLVVNANNPPACNYSQSGTQDCTPAERSSGSGVRSAANAPRAGSGGSSSPPSGSLAAPPGSTGPTVAGFDPATGVVLSPDGTPLQFGGTGGQYALAGDKSWIQLLLSGLAP